MCRQKCGNCREWEFGLLHLSWALADNWGKVGLARSFKTEREIDWRKQPQWPANLIHYFALLVSMIQIWWGGSGRLECYAAVHIFFLAVHTWFFQVDSYVYKMSPVSIWWKEILTNVFSQFQSVLMFEFGWKTQKWGKKETFATTTGPFIMHNTPEAGQNCLDPLVLYLYTRSTFGFSISVALS